MKYSSVNTIIFSPTGKTRIAAETLANALGSVTASVDLTRHSGNYSACSFGPEDLCIIAVPSFGGRVPRTALQRILQIQACKTPAVLLIAYGARAYEDTLLELQDTALQAGFYPIAAIAAVTEHSICRDIARGRPDSKDIEEIRSFAEQVQTLLTEQSSLENAVLSLPGNKPFRLYHPSPCFAPADPEKCIRCRHCVQNCPVNAIDPVTLSLKDDSCISCMRCQAICPVHARILPQGVMNKIHGFLQMVCQNDRKNEIFLAVFPDQPQEI